MKALLFGLCLALPFAAHAHAEETYFRQSWPGEYPTNFSVKKKVTVKVRMAPEASAVPGEDCTLAKGAKYGPNHPSRDADTYTRSKVRRYHATKDLTLEEQNDSGETIRIPLKAGDLVEELTYWSEGYCRVRVAGQTFDMTCPSNGGERDYRAEEDYDFSTNHEEWLSLTCLGIQGRRWLLLKELEPQFTSKALEVEAPQG